MNTLAGRKQGIRLASTGRRCSSLGAAAPLTRTRSRSGTKQPAGATGRCRNSWSDSSKHAVWDDRFAFGAVLTGPRRVLVPHAVLA